MKTVSIRWFACGWLALGALGSACGGGDDDDSGASACERAGQAICAAACDCRDGDACAVTDEAGAATMSFDTEADCLGMYVTLGCTGGGNGTIDFAACEADVAAAECFGAGADGAVVSPASCNTQ